MSAPLERIVEIRSNADMEEAADYATYLFSYHFQGAEWGVDIQARSETEARERLSRAAAGSCDGILDCVVPGSFGWCAPLYCWVRGAWRWFWKS